MATGTPVKVWFVNVGHGDCTIVKFPSGRIMMVDICNSRVLDKDTRSELSETEGLTAAKFLLAQVMDPRLDEATFFARGLSKYQDLLDDPLELMKTDPELIGRDIFRFILTHPDMDHMTGMYRLFQKHDGIDIDVENFWDTENTKGDPTKHGEGYDPRDWEEYKRIRVRTSDPKVLHVYRGYSADFYRQDNISILSPTPTLKDECNEEEDWNNISQVLRIVHGSSSLILPGDVEAKAQANMVEKFGGDLQSSVLKAPHHGRDSGYYEDFAAAVNPDYTIVSVGKKPDNDASSKYKKHTKKSVFSTRFQGTIYCELYPDGDVRLWNSPKKGRDRIDADAELEGALIKILRGRRSTRV